MLFAGFYYVVSIIFFLIWYKDFESGFKFCAHWTSKWKPQCSAVKSFSVSLCWFGNCEMGGSEGAEERPQECLICLLEEAASVWGSCCHESLSAYAKSLMFLFSFPNSVFGVLDVRQKGLVPWTYRTFISLDRTSCWTGPDITILIWVGDWGRQSKWPPVS